jgi:hypothetical protein
MHCQNKSFLYYYLHFPLFLFAGYQYNSTKSEEKMGDALRSILVDRVTEKSKIAGSQPTLTPQVATLRKRYSLEERDSFQVAIWTITTSSRN